MIWRGLMYSGVACLTVGTWCASPQQGAYSVPLLVLGGCLIVCAWIEAVVRSISTPIKRTTDVTTGRFNTAEFYAQLASGAKLMAAFEEYAIKIGCVVGTGAMCDSVECDKDQAKLLAAWWEKRTK